MAEWAKRYIPTPPGTPESVKQARRERDERNAAWLEEHGRPYQLGDYRGPLSDHPFLKSIKPVRKGACSLAY